MAGFFVTGTDTCVGKTWVTHGLISVLARTNERVVGMKPVASGCLLTGEGLRSEDALLLQKAATVAVDYDLVNPYAFAPAIAPERASLEAGVLIEPDRVLSCFQSLSAISDQVVVEGVGGWRVPLHGDYDVAAMAQQLELPVVVVVAIRLGCINHARLTIESIINAGLPVRGWVASCLDSAEVDQDTVRALTDSLPVPCIGVVPQVHSCEQVAGYLQVG